MEYKTFFFIGIILLLIGVIVFFALNYKLDNCTITSRTAASTSAPTSAPTPAPTTTN